MSTCLIISAPSGVGKTTVIKEILKKRSNFELSVSFTTRKIRNGERDEQDYYFISHNEFQKKIDEGNLLEHAQVFDNFYGTCNKTTQKILNSGRGIIFDIDWQGAQQILNSSLQEKILSIFLLPPSLQELKKRLLKRQTDDELNIIKRLQGAKEEITHHDLYDYILINDDLPEVVRKINLLIEAWLLHSKNNQHIKKKIGNLLTEVLQ